jgi:hypothetical protein
MSNAKRCEVARRTNDRRTRWRPSTKRAPFDDPVAVRRRAAHETRIKAQVDADGRAPTTFRCDGEQTTHVVRLERYGPDPNRSRPPRENETNMKNDCQHNRTVDNRKVGSDQFHPMSTIDPRSPPRLTNERSDSDRVLQTFSRTGRIQSVTS